MNWGTRILIIWCLIPAGEICAQQLSHQVLVPLAGVAGSNKLSYSQTVGETAVEIFGCSDFIFTQGFQQPGVKLTTETPPMGTGANVYPNPVHDLLTFELFGISSNTLKIEILNITGMIMYSEKISFTDQYWYKEQYDTGSLPAGIYFVRVVSESGLLNRTFKIEKL